MFTPSPSHIAIIMDGNGRWAQLRGHARTFGHIRGAKAARRIIEYSAAIKIPHLTLYAFSTENWFRPKSEVNLLMKLLAKNLKRERKNLMKNNIRFECIGESDRIPEVVLNEVRESIRITAENTGMILTFALSYGGRQEILSAAKMLCEKVERGELSPENITEEMFESCLQTYPIPDPDLIIRTSGESRLSNFLTWQSAYSEIYITPALWPDFTEGHLDSALRDYANRERRFGKVKCEQIQHLTEPVAMPLSTT
jgi:undecaprenyl diphosphate synthase